MKRRTKFVLVIVVLIFIAVAVYVYAPRSGYDIIGSQQNIRLLETNDNGLWVNLTATKEQVDAIVSEILNAKYTLMPEQRTYWGEYCFYIGDWCIVITENITFLCSPNDKSSFSYRTKPMYEFIQNVLDE